MNNLNSQEEEFLRKIFSEAGTEKPSLDFHKKILAQIESSHSLTFEPLISPKVLKFIGVGLIALVVVTILFVPGSESTLPYWDKVNDFFSNSNLITLPSIRLPKIHLGPVFNVSIFAFSILSFTWILYTFKRYPAQ